MEMRLLFRLLGVELGLVMELKINSYSIDHVVTVVDRRFLSIFSTNILPVWRAGHEGETEGSHERPAPGVGLALPVLPPPTQTWLVLRPGTEVANIERSSPAD